LLLSPNNYEVIYAALIGTTTDDVGRFTHCAPYLR